MRKRWSGIISEGGRIDPRVLGTQLSSAASPNQVIKINAYQSRLTTSFSQLSLSAFPLVLAIESDPAKKRLEESRCRAGWLPGHALQERPARLALEQSPRRVPVGAKRNRTKRGVNDPWAMTTAWSAATRCALAT